MAIQSYLALGGCSGLYRCLRRGGSHARSGSARRNGGARRSCADGGGLVFDLTATEEVRGRHIYPDGTRDDWGNRTTFSYFTPWREAGGIYKLIVMRKSIEISPEGNTIIPSSAFLPSEVTVSYRVEPLPAREQCDPADQ